MAPTPNQLKFNGWFASGIPWAEYIGPHGSTADAAFSYGQGNQAVMTIAVLWEDTQDAIVDILGYPSVSFSPGTGGLLSRHPPLQHPLYGQLYASRITGVQQIQFQGKDVVNTEFYGAANTPASTYTFSFLTVVFTMPKYVILTDAEVDGIYGSPRQEYRRYVSMAQWNPTSSVLQRPGGASFVYSEGPFAGKEVPGTVNQKLTEGEFVLTWHQVPRVGLFNDQGIGAPGSPTLAGSAGSGLLGGLNTVNASAFLGYPALTLRVNGFRFRELESPVPSQLLGINPIISPPLCYDVDIIFGWAERPFDSGSASQQGWLAFPALGEVNWYLAVDTASGDTILSQSSFANMFVMQE